MKKLLLGIGVLSLSFSLAACGSDSASTDKTDSDSSKTTQQEEKATKETKTDQKSKTLQRKIRQIKKHLTRKSW
ncbi:hypothetical protein [Bacillus atrophaeus]|uniref:hypothetical protein n=1 Tax=Bacillus atrophaeus TaxID=1452 RepID=UPI002E1466E1